MKQHRWYHKENKIMHSRSPNVYVMCTCLRLYNQRLIIVYGTTIFFVYKVMDSRPIVHRQECAMFWDTFLV
jgi:hypothetical protein